jgi:hypothetical protein
LAHILRGKVIDHLLQWQILADLPMKWIKSIFGRVRVATGRASGMAQGGKLIELCPLAAFQ